MTKTPFLLITLTVYIWLYMYVDDVICTNFNKIFICLPLIEYNIKTTFPLIYNIQKMS